MYETIGVTFDQLVVIGKFWEGINIAIIGFAAYSIEVWVQPSLGRIVA